MFDRFIITDHFMGRYEERVGGNKKELEKKIKRDLHFTKVKRIVNDGDHRHIFTRNSKEFIFKKDGNIWILKTVIKRNRRRNPKAINQRVMEATN